MKLRKGFTLIELLVVVAIIGILVLIAVPRFTTMTEGAREASVEANHRIIVSAISMAIANQNGIIPDKSEVDEYLPIGGIDAIEASVQGASHDYNESTGGLISTINDKTFTFTP